MIGMGAKILIVEDEDALVVALKTGRPVLGGTDFVAFFTQAVPERNDQGIFVFDN